MTYSFAGLAEALKGGAAISAEDVISARRWAWNDGAISQAEAETLFELNALASDAPHEWADFFVEAMTDYLVHRTPPRGYIDDANAAWLMAQVDRDGRVDTAAELELIVKVMEAALNAPPALKDYALRQVETIVISGEGPTRRGGALRPGMIDEAEVALLRRLIFAPGGDGALIVTREEAEMLWRLKDATLGADNAAGWPDLFVKAIANHLMAHSSYRALDRDEAARLEAFVGDTGSSVGRFLGRMFGGDPREGFRQLFGEKPRAPDHGAAAEAAQAVTPEEAKWVEARIDADGRTDPLEQALLAFLREEGGSRG